MPTVSKDVVVYAGETSSWPDSITNAAGGVQDITGWSVTFAYHATGGPALATKTVGNGIVLTTPAQGLLTVTLLAADVAQPGCFEYSIARTDAGAEAVLSQGRLVVLAR